MTLYTTTGFTIWLWRNFTSVKFSRKGEIMKKIFIVIAIILSMLDASIATPIGQSANRVEAATAAISGAGNNEHSSAEVTGEISDSHCRFKHMGGMESDETCVLHCLAGPAKLVLADREKRVIYTLDEEGQKEARKFAGRKVRITGHVMETRIHVEKIEAAK